MASNKNIVSPDVPPTHGKVPRNVVYGVAIVLALLCALVVMLRPEESASAPANAAAAAQTEAASQPAPSGTFIDEQMRLAEEKKARDALIAAQEQQAKAKAAADEKARAAAAGNGPLNIPNPGGGAGAGGMPRGGQAGAEGGRSAEVDAQIANSPMIVHDVAPNNQANGPSRGNDPFARLEQEARAAQEQSSRAAATEMAGANEQIARAMAAAGQGGAGGARQSGDNPDAQGRSWMTEMGGQRRNASLRPYAPEAQVMLMAGATLDAVTTCEMVSTLPGEMCARVVSDVYDSIIGNRLVIPMGSVITGAYNADIRPGQARMMGAATRLILPDGTAFDLSGAGMADHKGASGATGTVNNHFFKIFGSALMTAVIQAVVTTQATSSGSVVINAGGAATNAAGQAFGDVTREILQRNRGIQPTITIPVGTPIKIRVTRDMVFSKPYATPKGTTR